MMEFYEESKHKSQKERICELCGHVINVGDYYYAERGKFYGEFFSRALHVHCHNMEREYCEEVDNEFSWDAITDYIQEKYCNKCEHAACNDDREDWTECDFYVTECPKLIQQFSDEEDKNNGSEN